MSIKGIIILDKPKFCIDCPCHFFDDVLWCGITKKEIESEDIEICKPDWCPIVSEPVETTALIAESALTAKALRQLEKVIEEYGGMV